MYQTSRKISFSSVMQTIIQKSGLATYAIMVIALLGFEMFNFSTTQVALSDLLGPLSFIGIQWATILAIAFCGIDFAGIARLFTPGEARNGTHEAWYLFGAWLLAATMNAILTWWGVSMALQGHQVQSTSIIDKKLMMQAVPIFVAIMVWVTRVLIIGSFSMAGQRTRTWDQRSQYNRTPANNRTQQQVPARIAGQTTSSAFDRPQSPLSTGNRPQPLATSSTLRSSIPSHPEPEYISESEPAAGTALPALRPMTASARPNPSGQDRRF
jgi:hypothetical protein